MATPFVTTTATTIAPLAHVGPDPSGSDPFGSDPFGPFDMHVLLEFLEAVKVMEAVNSLIYEGPPIMTYMADIHTFYWYS